MTTANEKPRTLPRRANTIRALAATMAQKKLSETNARQAVSDRIGYAAAAMIGAFAFKYGGEGATAAIVLLYAVSAVFAHRRHKKATASTVGPRA